MTYQEDGVSGRGGGAVRGLLPVPGVITERLLAVVAALQRLPVATTAPGVAATARVPERTARTLLRGLHDAGWVRRERLYHLRRSGCPPYGYQLTDAGRRTAAARFDPPSPSGDAA